MLTFSFTHTISLLLSVCLSSAFRLFFSFSLRKKNKRKIFISPTRIRSLMSRPTRVSERETARKRKINDTIKMERLWIMYCDYISHIREWARQYQIASQLQLEKCHIESELKQQFASYKQKKNRKRRMWNSSSGKAILGTWKRKWEKNQTLNKLFRLSSDLTPFFFFFFSLKGKHFPIWYKLIWLTRSQH